MADAEENRTCPHCGVSDVPILIVTRARAGTADGGMGWRCHSCRRNWTDEEFRQLRAS